MSATTSTIITERIDAVPAEAALSNEGGRWVLSLHRVLPGRVEEVWPMLVEPAGVARWSPLVPDRTLTSTGPATFREDASGEGVDGEVVVSDAPRELVERCGDQILRWTLETAEGGTRLTLEHTFDKRGDDASFAAGWHVCLAVLDVALAGHDVERVVGMRAMDYGWAALKDRYESVLV